MSTQPPVTAPVPLVPLAEGTLITYTYQRAAGPVTVTGRKGPSVNPGANGGFRILDEAGAIVATITRHARVQVTA